MNSCSPCSQNPFSAMCITSAPDSVSCSCARSMSSGPMPAISKAAFDASTVGPALCSRAIDGANTSKLPKRRLRTTAAFR
ncbi:unannotated protein [freshwater metagenome]|uniref:Unannotated protein n=1 Tax=freshwater metagenome TaxID=449393 RepID=A0A6J6FKN3_9ZZZZ